MNDNKKRICYVLFFAIMCFIFGALGVAAFNEWRGMGLLITYSFLLHFIQGLQIYKLKKKLLDKDVNCSRSN